MPYLFLLSYMINWSLKDPILTSLPIPCQYQNIDFINPTSNTIDDAFNRQCMLDYCHLQRYIDEIENKRTLIIIHPHRKELSDIADCPFIGISSSIHLKQSTSNFP